MADARWWATGTAKTAIDLCAADAAVAYGINSFWGGSHEDFAPTATPERLARDISRLSDATAEWLSALLKDPDYQALKSARDAFTHRMTVRSALVIMGPPEGSAGRTLFAVDVPGIEGRPDARALVVFSRETATRQVEGFCAAVSSQPS